MNQSARPSQSSQGSSNLPTQPTAPPTATLPTAPCIPFLCYECGKTGHGINECADMLDLLSKGIGKKNDTGCFVMSNGSRIMQSREEPIATAVHCTIPKSNLLTTTSFMFIAEVADSDSDSDKKHVYIVDHPDRVSKEKCKQIFDGVYIPPRPDWAKAIKKKKKEEEKPVVPTIAPAPSKPHIFDIAQPIFDPTNDNVIMEDTSQTAKKNPPANK
ncbi:hypothetical protein SERLADRAFT_444153 [Serpula lacrymans var. lacrymans S7.9]|uniref:CCHC-type domain-containing protein n=1 Tax=Serpula lacrymans var. lacrymans (strain S7.9) TaxID=578457 RepID=F8PEN8_SERL9|nr:uncharacterized protein SERLADRAFT_444153 [Serpula lacrymans var. lacrymans S7.9]EGO18407.1 hypothetical protein SERLADRAFT_444153 [Serpula lacrymans var. lacrymans S7.9]